MKNELRKLNFATSVLLIAVLLFAGLSITLSPEVGFAFAALWLFAAMFGLLPIGAGADALNIEDTTWSGPALEYMITRAVVDTDTILNDCVNVVQEVSRKQITIPRLEVSTLIQHYTPEPSNAGAVTVDGRQLTLNKFELYYEFNPQDFEVHFFEQDFDETRLIDETLPDIAENYIMLQTMKRLNEWFENGFWNSRKMFDPAGANVAPSAKGYPDNTLQSNANFYWDGFLYKLLQDSTTQTLSYNPANFTAANFRGNVLTPLKNTIINNNISKALAYKYGKLGMRYLMSYQDQAVYEEALRTDLYKNQDSTQTAINRYRGNDIVPLAGLDEGTVILSIARPDNQSNFWLGVNSTEDVMLEMAHKAKPSDLWYVKGIFKLDTNHGFGDQAVICTPVVS